MTLVELACATVLVLVGIGGLLSSVSSSVVLSRATHQSTAAQLAGQSLLEELRREPVENVFARYNGDLADDPVGGAPGPDFAVRGLDPIANDPDGFVGRISFPVEPAAPGSLREDLATPEFGPARDLDADGVIDAFDHAADYRALPVRIRIDWRGPSGNRVVELFTILGGAS